MESNSEQIEDSPNKLIGKLSYELDRVLGNLNIIRGDLNMGDNKAALVKINELIRYMEALAVIELYKDGEANSIKEC